MCASCRGAGDAARRADPLVGQFIDEFEILELLREGATARVYRARQTSLGRVVALKVLAPAAGGQPEEVARFRRQADAAAAVAHPNVVEVHVVGRQADHHFIAMELVAGESLADILGREGPLPGERVLAVMRHVAEALVSVHAAGFRHCDIQPSHVLVAPGGGVKLIGFGMARRAGEAGGQRRAAGGPGAPLYLPPETARGRAPDERADLYQLGATCFHAAAGRPPLAATPPDGGAGAAARREAPRLDRIVPTAPMALCRIIHRLVRRRPEARYRSAQELLDALDRVSGLIARGRLARWRRSRPEPPQARRSANRQGHLSEPPTVAERAQARRHQEKQVLLLSGAALLVLLIVAILLALVL